MRKKLKFIGFILTLFILSIVIQTGLAYAATARPAVAAVGNCVETQFGPAEQENTLFCQSPLGATDDGNFLYVAAINAANARLIAGTPLDDTPSFDWGGSPIRYVEFSSGLHAEYHGDDIVRFYDTYNLRRF